MKSEPLKVRYSTTMAGSEYWPMDGKEKFKEQFNTLLLCDIAGYTVKTLDRITLKYNTSLDTLSEIDRVRNLFIRRWVEQLQARSTTVHPFDRDIVQFAVVLEINDILYYAYPLERIKRYKDYDEVTFMVREVEE